MEDDSHHSLPGDRTLAIENGSHGSLLGDPFPTSGGDIDVVNGR